MVGLKKILIIKHLVLGRQNYLLVMYSLAINNDLNQSLRMRYGGVLLYFDKKTLADLKTAHLSFQNDRLFDIVYAENMQQSRYNFIRP